MNAQQLKNSILQEAIEGRLVPQDPNDEPASVLLERIREEKKRLVKEGKLKKKDLEETPISEDEIPFDIPDSWEWVRINDLGEIITGGTPSKENQVYYGDEYPFYKPGDLDKGINISSSADGLSQKGFDASRKLKAYSILVTCIGATIGKAGLITKPGSCNQQINAIIPYNVLCPQYIYYTICSPLLQSIIRKDAGQTTLPIMNKNNFSKLPFPLPPLAEQKRIVAKIEELLPKVGEYGKAQDALDKLNAELPERLKKSILQEAISGRLVPQDPNDEPASVLLDKIRAEKAKLVKEGKLKKKDLEETPIQEDEIPFDIPNSWEWVRLGSVCNYIHRGKSPKYGEKKILPIIAQKCNQWGHIYTDRCLFAQEDTIERYTEEQYIQMGDVIINSTGGGTVGRTGFVDDYVFREYKRYVVDSHVTVVRGNKDVFSKYIYYFLISPLIQFNLEDRCSGSTNQIELGTSTIYNYILPLPPLAEQKRIVAKIEQLLGEIEKLK